MLDRLHPRLWASGDPPPRAGGTLEVLIDGAEALTRLAEELRKAESHVHLAGWFVPRRLLGPLQGLLVDG